MSYPINVNTDTLKDDRVKQINQIVEYAEKKEWSQLLDAVGDDSERANATKIVKKNSPAKLNTPLHLAALGSAPKDVFEQLVKAGSSRCLKNTDNETAHDIGVRVGLPQDVLNVIKVPEGVVQKKEIIQKMEQGLHQVILGRVSDLIKGNSQKLPQLDYLYERGSFYYPVPGMYGGFNVEEKDGGGVVVDSWIRVCGGSGQRHEIDKDGNVKLTEEGFV